MECDERQHQSERTHKLDTIHRPDGQHQETQMPLANLEGYLISSLPSFVYYIPSFVPPDVCEALLNTIKFIPPHRWTSLARRRLMSIPSPLTGKARDTLLLSSSLPSYLTDLILTKFEELGIFDESVHGAPNHVLVNEYLPGQGIMPHEDGPAYYPVTATVSLGGTIVLDMYSKTKHGDGPNDSHHWRVLQEPGSLLVTMGECYGETLHGIAEKGVDEDLNEGGLANWHLLGDKTRFQDGRNVRTTRISLTYRDVKKAVKMGGFPKNSLLGKP